MQADEAVHTHDRRWAIRLYELAISVPVVAYLFVSFAHAFTTHTALVPDGDWVTPVVWALAVAVAEMLPVPTNVSMAFSLSFPLELSAALIFPTPVAAAIGLFGSIDARELRGELPPLKALFIRSQIAVCVIVESLIFKVWVQPAQLGTSPLRLIVPTFLAAVAGYATNTLIVAFYDRLQTGHSVRSVIRDMHQGVFGEFVLSYMGLALFAVLVASAFSDHVALAIIVFAAPLAFARQMFRRTHSLQEATSKLAAKQAENEYQAMHDSLTGLPNRMLFQLRLSDAIDEARRTGDRIAVMLIDLDHFKEINDTLGHHYGDLLLQEIGPRLSRVLRDEDLMARLGGDEFGIVLPDLPSEEIAMQVASRLLEELQIPMSVEGLALDVSGSVGIAMFPLQADDAESLLRHADVAMYAAKESGGGYELYDDDLDQHNPSRLTLIGQVRPALEAREFVMHYQPKVRLADGRVAGAEALIRWEHPVLGLLPPDEFIPLVEKTVLLRPLTRYVIVSVLQQWRAWADMGIRIPIAINISTRSLLDQELPDQIEEELKRWDVPPAYLRLELTESFLMGDSGRSTLVLDRLARVGVGLSIDDFGTGYSSLSYLKRLRDRGDQDRPVVRHADAGQRERLDDRACDGRPRPEPRPPRRRRGRRGSGDVRSAARVRLRRGAGLRDLAPLVRARVHALAVGPQPRAAIRDGGPHQRGRARTAARRLAPLDRQRDGALEPAGSEGSEGLVRGRERERRHVRAHRDLGRERQEPDAVGAREVRDRAQHALPPQQVVGERRDVAHRDLRADHDAPRRDRPQRERHQRTGRREHDRGVERLRRHLGRPAGPLGAEVPRERLGGDVARTCEREDPPALVPRDLREDVGRAAEPDDPEPLGVAGEPQGAVPDQPGAQQRRRLAIGERVRHGEAEARVGDGELRVPARQLIPGEARVRAEVLPAGRARAADAARPPEPRHADPVADRRAFGALAERVDHADDLMPEDEGQDRFGEVAVDDMEVGAADPADMDAEPHLARARLGVGQLGGAQRRSRTVQHHRAHARSVDGGAA